MIDLLLASQGNPFPTVKFSRERLLMLSRTVLPLGQPQSHGWVFRVLHSLCLKFIFKVLALALISPFPRIGSLFGARTETGTQPLWIQTLPPADDKGGHPAPLLQPSALCSVLQTRCVSRRLYVGTDSIPFLQ